MDAPLDGQPREPPAPPAVPKPGDDGKIAEFLVKWCARVHHAPECRASITAHAAPASGPDLLIRSSIAVCRHHYREHYAHVHCEWVTESLLESIAPRKLKNYIEKKGAGPLACGCGPFPI